MSSDYSCQMLIFLRSENYGQFNGNSNDLNVDVPSTGWKKKRRFDDKLLVQTIRNISCSSGVKKDRFLVKNAS